MNIIIIKAIAYYILQQQCICISKLMFMRNRRFHEKKIKHFALPISFWAIVSFSSCSECSPNATSTPKYTDSFVSIEQEKVIGNLKFGMNKSECQKELDIFNKKQEINVPYSKSLFDTTTIYQKEKKIGNYRYDTIITKYDMDKLYSIYIVGTKNQYEMSDLARLITQKYGNPDFENDTELYVKNDDHIPHYTIYDINVKSWNIGKKKIDITLRGFINDSNIYSEYVNLHIFLPTVENKLLLERQHREQFTYDSIQNKADIEYKHRTDSIF